MSFVSIVSTQINLSETVYYLEKKSRKSLAWCVSLLKRLGRLISYPFRQSKRLYKKARDTQKMKSYEAKEKQGTLSLEERHCLGRLYYDRGLYEKTFVCYKKAALKGDRDAMCSIGLMLRQGKGTEKDLSAGLYWYNEAAKQEEPFALHNLGIHYESIKEYDTAESHYRRASAAGHPEAKWALARLMVEKKLSSDEKEAFSLCKEAAKEEIVPAMSLLGWLYGQGKGVEQNNQKSFYWLFKAALRGDVDAMVDLAEIYEKGIGRKANSRLASLWYKLAAKKGDAEAQERLKSF